MKVTILGGGRVGRAIAADLARRGNFLVRVADLDRENLSRLEKASGVETLAVDLSRQDGIREAVEGAEIVIDAVPGFLGFQTLKAVIEAEKDVVDIAFFPEDPFEALVLAAPRIMS